MTSGPHHTVSHGHPSDSTMIPPPIHFESQVSAHHLLKLTQPYYQALSHKEVHVHYSQIIPVGKGEDFKVIHEVIHLSPSLSDRVSSQRLPSCPPHQPRIHLYLRRESDVRHLQIRIVSQGVVCVHSVHLGSFFTEHFLCLTSTYPSFRNTSYLRLPPPCITLLCI